MNILSLFFVLTFLIQYLLVFLLFCLNVLYFISLLEIYICMYLSFFLCSCQSTFNRDGDCCVFQCCCGVSKPNLKIRLLFPEHLAMFWWEQVDSNHRHKNAYVSSVTFSRTSYDVLVGTSGLEPPTSRLSGVCSNQLSYVPI